MGELSACAAGWRHDGSGGGGGGGGGLSPGITRERANCFPLTPHLVLFRFVSLWGAVLSLLVVLIIMTGEGGFPILFRFYVISCGLLFFSWGLMPKGRGGLTDGVVV